MMRRAPLMGTHNLIEILILIVMVTLSLSAVVPVVRYELRKFRSRGWPVVLGTIQKGEILHSGATKFLYVPFRSLLGYTYTVNGHPYWGYFALVAEDRDLAEKLQLQAEGRPVSVRYDPKTPEVSLLEDRELLGRRVIQDPMYLDHS